MKLLFYKGKGKLFDKLIRWQTKGKYSHCELCFSDDFYFSADAWKNEVRFTRFNPNPENWDQVEIYLTPKEELVVRAWADSQVGKGYDWLGILGFLLPFIKDDPLRYFCSEICVEALQQAHKLVGLKSHECSPVHLAEIYGL